MKLTEHVVSSSGPVTAAELAKITGSEKLLIGKGYHLTGKLVAYFT
jgi:hypothetical protein